MEEKYSGIVVGATSFGENDKILKIFTLEKGVISAKIKGVKKAGAKLKFATEPFCFSEYLFSQRNGMRTVIGASLIDSFYPIREDVVKYFSAGAVIELVKKFYRENISSELGFVLAVNALKELAYGDNGAEIPLIKYIVNMLEENGFSLTLNKCFCCEGNLSGRIFFDYRRGGFFCEKCFDGVGREVNLSTFDALNDVMNGNNPEKEFKQKALKLLDYYIENRTDEKINSIKELIKIL